MCTCKRRVINSKAFGEYKSRCFYFCKKGGQIMSERFLVSTFVGDDGLYYRVYDKKSGKIIECGVGELNNTIWKLLGV